MATLLAPTEDFAALPELPGEVFTAPLKKPAHVGDDWLEPAQRDYSSEEHAIWDELYARQMDVLPGRAAGAFLAGTQKLALGRGGVPEFARLSKELGALTGWSVVPVPMLTDPIYADYMQEYGRAGWKAMRHNRLKALGALYWYTVEFGLIMEGENLRAYGAGILSGPTEAVFALEARSPNRIFLNVDRVMRTDYVIDDLQPTYFVIESLEDLYHQTVDRDFDRLYRALGPGFTYANTAVIDVDNVLHRGTQEYFLRGGRASGANAV
jgi:phenylalanine-4-hydroxylase